MEIGDKVKVNNRKLRQHGKEGVIVDFENINMRELGYGSLALVKLKHYKDEFWFYVKELDKI